MAVFRLTSLSVAVCLFLLFCRGDSSSQKKVVFTSIPYLSHIAFQMDLAMELSQRGYSVAVALPSNFKDFIHRTTYGRVQFLDLGNYTNNEEYVRLGSSKLDYAEASVWIGLEMDRLFKALLVPLTDVLEKERPDVVVADNNFILGIQLGFQLGIPVVGTYIGGDPGDITNFCKDFELTLLRRLKRLWYLARIYLTLYTRFKWYYGIHIDDVIPDQFVQPLYGVHISFPGYNFPFRFEYPPTHVFVGFISRNLNESDYHQEDLELKKYLDELPGDTEVVYVAFGSVVKAKFPVLDVVVQGVLNSRDNLIVVLSWPGFESMPHHWLSHRVRVEKWTHQLMVLKHNRTKLFVTHGGVRSMGEAIFSHKPVIVVPQYMDQMGNGLLAMRAGIGLCITNAQDVTAKAVEERVTTILSNYSSFTDSIKVVDKLRQLAGGASRAGDLIESVFHDCDRPLWVYTNQDKLESLYLVLTPLLLIGIWMIWRRCYISLQAVFH